MCVPFPSTGSSLNPGSCCCCFSLHLLLRTPSRAELEPSRVSADSEGPYVPTASCSPFFWEGGGVKQTAGLNLLGAACSWRESGKCCGLGSAKGSSPFSHLPGVCQDSKLVIPPRNGGLSQFPQIYNLCPYSCHLCPSPMAVSFWDS